MGKPRSTEGTLKEAVLERMHERPKAVWTPVDFVDLASRDAVDKLLQRLANGGRIRRIERGLYDLPRPNALTGRPTVPDYREVIDAVARAILGPNWWPSCGLCSWRARFSVRSGGEGWSSHGYSCADHLPIFVGYSTDNGQACTVEPVRIAS